MFIRFLVQSKIDVNWWKKVCAEEEFTDLEYSSKLVLLFSIITECEARSEKLLIFSQSLFSLQAIEHFLAEIDKNTRQPDPSAKLCGFTGQWKFGVDYFRLDGQTEVSTRAAYCDKFNKTDD